MLAFVIPTGGARQQYRRGEKFSRRFSFLLIRQWIARVRSFASFALSPSPLLFQLKWTVATAKSPKVGPTRHLLVASLQVLV